MEAHIKSAKPGFPDQTHHACGIIDSAKPGAKISHKIFCLFATDKTVGKMLVKLLYPFSGSLRHNDFSAIGIMGSLGAPVLLRHRAYGSRTTAVVLKPCSGTLTR